jgi:hypothetical protein
MKIKGLVLPLMLTIKLTEVYEEGRKLIDGSPLSNILKSYAMMVKKMPVGAGEFFRWYVNHIVDNQIMHEGVDACHAPRECHDDVNHRFVEEIEEMENKLFISEQEMRRYWGDNVLYRAVGRLHGIKCPYCGKWGWNDEPR